LAEGDSVNVGVAAHISAAAVGGPRYNGALTPAERASIKNGIWLCQTCAKIIDADELRYPEPTLLGWKRAAEHEAQRRIGKATSSTKPASAERALKRDLKLRDDMRREFLKPWNEVYREHSGNPVRHPYEKLRHAEAIIHRIGDDRYPDMEDGPGISSWFKVELFDFYHRGIKVILGIESGVIELGWGYPGNKGWGITSYEADFDHNRFRRIGIWKLGLIPFRNIRHYDLDGDEYYNFPHIYCLFSINGMPNEGLECAVVGEEEYDWPLKDEFRIPEDAVANPHTPAPK
jgi:hypothetical protein